jgi:hypothetical protein
MTQLEHNIHLTLPRDWHAGQVKEFAESWYAPRFRIIWATEPRIVEVLEDPMNGVEVAKWRCTYHLELYNNFLKRAGFRDEYLEPLIKAKRQWEQRQK